MYRALVTGANGFIGSHLVEKLISEKVEVRCLVRQTSNLQWIDRTKVSIVFGDINQPESLEPAVKDVDLIYHLAGKTAAQSEAEYRRVNVFGTELLLKTISEHNPHLKRFVFISSQAAGGPSTKDHPLTETSDPHPVTPYGRSKLAAEKAVRGADRIPFTIIRPPSVFGPRDTDFLQLFQTVQKGVITKLGFKERRYSMIYVEDLVRGIWQASINPDTVNQLYYLADPEPVSWEQLCKAIAEVFTKKTISLSIPVPLFAMVVLISDAYSKVTGKRVILNKGKLPEFMARYWECQPEKAVHTFGFKPDFTLKEGVEKTVRWYRTNGWL